MAKVTDHGNELFNQIASEMAKYEQVFANSKFTQRAAFMDKYAGWDGLHIWQDEVKYKPQEYYAWHGTYSNVEALDYEKAKPFIRAVIERMLDLLDNEDRWVKNAVAKTASGAPAQAEDAEASKWCLIGAQARALNELELGKIQMDDEVERQRHRVIAAVDAFLKDRIYAEHGHRSLPSWNDQSDTNFEDVRLWLKSCLTHLED